MTDSELHIDKVRLANAAPYLLAVCGWPNIQPQPPWMEVRFWGMLADDGRTCKAWQAKEETAP